MSVPLLFAMPGNEAMTQRLVPLTRGDVGTLQVRNFPDRETYLRFRDKLSGRSVALVCTLADPDPKILPLLFAADTARELGAVKVGLVAPYLAYMRQDRRFHPGEAITSRRFAAILSQSFDWLVTIDPHLHRYKSLAELYSIPTRVLHSGTTLSKWIVEKVPNPFIVGPDEESEQWVAEIARESGAPYSVLHKRRLEDERVEIDVGHLGPIGNKTPILVDDIISSGGTMLEAIRKLAELVRIPPVCLAVHGIFANHSDQLLVDAGARLVTTDSIENPHAEIGIAPLLASAISEFVS